MKDTSWITTQVERIFCGMFIRISATPNEHRWRWFIMPVDLVAKAPNWYRAPGKGSSTAQARGYSSSLEKACADSEAMAKQLSIGRETPS